MQKAAGRHVQSDHTQGGVPEQEVRRDEKDGNRQNMDGIGRDEDFGRNGS